MKNSVKKTARALLATLFIVGVGTLIVRGLDVAVYHLIAAMAIAYLVFPAVRWLEQKKIKGYQIKREVAVISVIAILVLALVGLLALAGKHIYAETVTFLDKLPQHTEVAMAKVQELTNRLGLDFKIDRESLVPLIKKYSSNISSDTVDSVAAALKDIFTNTANIMVFIANLYVLPLFFFYIINSYERIMDRARELIPLPLRPGAESFFSKCGAIFKDYLRGQVLLAVARALLYSVGLMAIGLNFGLVLGLLSGMLSIIPFVGVSIGIVGAGIIALSTGAGLGVFLGACGVYLVVFLLDELVLTPKLIEERSGLSSMTILLALIVGGNLFGILGAFMAIPGARILKIIITEIGDRYRQSTFFVGSET